MKLIFSCVLFLLFFAVTVFPQLEERNRAIAHYYAGEYDRVIAILEDLRAQKLADHPSLTHLAAAYYKTGKKSNALDILGALSRPAALLGKFEYQRELKVLKRPPASCGEVRDYPRKVKVLVEYGSDGKVGFALPFTDDMSSFVKNAVAAAKMTRFEPAQAGDKNVSTIGVASYECIPLMN